MTYKAISPLFAISMEFIGVTLLSAEVVLFLTGTLLAFRILRAGSAPLCSPLGIMLATITMARLRHEHWGSRSGCVSESWSNYMLHRVLNHAQTRLRQIEYEAT